MKKPKILLILILLLAAAVRLYKLTAISLWHDEAFSALLINYSWKEMFYRIGLDVHPPLYYVFLRVWSYVFGHSLWSLRGFSALFGVLTVYAAYLFVKAAFKRERLALGAALLIAVSQFQIEYVTEARMYTFGAFFLLLSAYFLVQAFETEKLRYWLGFILTTSIAMYSHYYLFFSVFAIGCFALFYLFRRYRDDFTKYSRLVGAYLVVLLLYVPWLKTFWFQFRQVEVSYWIPPINAWSVPLTNWRMLLGTGADPSKPLSRVLLVTACALSIFMIYRVLKKEQSIYKWLVIFGAVIPFIGGLAMSLKQSIYLDRYFLFAGLFYTVLAALFILEIKDARLRYALFGLMVFASLFNWASFWSRTDPDNRPGMAAASRYLDNNVESGDKLLVGSSFEFFNLKYYNRSQAVPALYTPGISAISQLPHFSGTALLTDQDIVSNLSTYAKSGDTVWVLWTNGFGGTKPALPSNWIQIGNDHSWQDIRPYAGTWIIVDQYAVR